MVVTEPRQITSPSLLRALGQHQPIGGQHCGRWTNHSAARGQLAPAVTDLSQWTRIDTRDFGDAEVICHFQSAHELPGLVLSDQSEADVSCLSTNQRTQRANEPLV